MGTFMRKSIEKWEIYLCYSWGFSLLYIVTLSHISLKLRNVFFILWQIIFLNLELVHVSSKFSYRSKKKMTGSKKRMWFIWVTSVRFKRYKKKWKDYESISITCDNWRKKKKKRQKKNRSMKRDAELDKINGIIIVRTASPSKQQSIMLLRIQLF